MSAPSACVLAAVLLVALGAPGVEPAEGALYVCGSDTLRVDPVGNWEAVVLHLDGGMFLLPRTIAASGVRYSDGERTFWMKGEGAFVEVGGVLARSGCVLVRSVAEDPWRVMDALDLPVLSYVSVDVAAFNERLRAASAAGEAWIEDPMRIAMEYAGDLEGRTVALLKTENAGEGATESTVEVVRDGLLDDSIRAIWDELHLARTDGGAWEFVRAYQAYRCRRGAHGRSYSAEPCQ